MEGGGEGQVYSPLNSFISQKNFDHPVKTIHNPFKKVIFLILENFQSNFSPRNNTCNFRMKWFTKMQAVKKISLCIPYF